ncbi:MAG: hypothetical protein IH789_10000 [Acidobacteria bacterium]|nr:hypothetical protein [Acidobacteriota bacterium]
MHRNLPVVILGLLLTGMLSSPDAAAQAPESGTEEQRYEYRLLATKKTSTMRKEMNRAAEDGFRFETVMGGKTSFGGPQVVVIMSRPVGSEASARYQYQLLATSKTSTMQKEMQEASDAAFEYRGQTVFKSTFGGEEVVVILERDLEVYPPLRYEYKLLATKKTSTMQKEMRAAAAQGFVLVGLTVSKTRFGGSEVVTIMRRRVAQ